jgi:hypothetical protein
MARVIPESEILRLAAESRPSNTVLAASRIPLPAEPSIEKEHGLYRRIIPKGTLLFRAADSLEKYVPSRIAQEANLCTDTDKRGLYFATYPFLSMCIATEYHRDMLLGVFHVDEDIVAADGKYTFRDLVFPGFSDQDEEDQIKLLQSIPSPLPEEFNINHFDPSINPLLFYPGSDVNVLEDSPFKERSVNTSDGNWGGCWMGELFLANPEDRAKCHLVDSFIIRHEVVPKIAEITQLYASVQRRNISYWLGQLESTRDLSGVPGGSPDITLPELKAGAIKKVNKTKS